MKRKDITFCWKTGFIKGEEGFTLVETLVATIILMIMVTLLTAAVNTLFNNKKYLKRSPAFFAARQELDKTLALKLTTDTLYAKDKPFLLIERRVRPYDKAFSAKVKVYTDTTGTKILELSGMFFK